MSIGLKGIFTPPAPEERDMAFLEVVHPNGNTYDWMAYIPRNQDVTTSLAAIESNIYNEITKKEAEWDALDPKTRVEINPMNGDETLVEIKKEEVVRPSSPDYYALRRAEYPSIGDQLDAFWKGPGSPQFESMLQKIADIKAKYPKP